MGLSHPKETWDWTGWVVPFGGMRWKEVARRVQFLTNIDAPPHSLYLHCGGNDLGKLPIGDLQFAILNTIQFWSGKLQHTRLVWSQILPRMTWRHYGIEKDLEAVRKRLNSATAKAVLTHGGCYIKYPDIKLSQPALFLPDRGPPFALGELYLSQYDKRCFWDICHVQWVCVS